MISIQDSNGILHCGGSIAKSNRIITAAHCFMDMVEKKKMDKAKNLSSVDIHDRLPSEDPSKKKKKKKSKSVSVDDMLIGNV